MKAPTFRDYDNPNRKNPHGWDYYEAGKRKRPTFETKKAKADFKRDFLRRWQGDRDSVLSFDADKWRAFLELERRAGSMDALARAVESASRFSESQEPERFSTHAKRRQRNLERINSPTVKHAELYASRFMRAEGDRPVSYYTREQVQLYIDALKGARSTLASNLRQIRAIFSLAVEADQIARNPCAGVRLPSGRGEKRLEIIDPVKLQKLLDHARKVDRPMSRLLAIAFFTGLRMSMIAPPPAKRARGEFLRADMIDIKAKSIVIPAGIMKTGAALATDDAPECLWPWLDGLVASDFGKSQNAFNSAKQKLCQDVNINWPANLHRRSFGSYFSALRGRDYAAKIMGDKTESVFCEHYEVSAFRSVAEKYAQISPTG